MMFLVSGETSLIVFLFAVLTSAQVLEEEEFDNNETFTFDTYREFTPTPMSGIPVNSTASESRRAQSLKNIGYFGEAIIRGEGGLRGYIFIQSSVSSKSDEKCSH